MAKATPGVDLALIESVLARGVWALWFPRGLEALFEAQTGRIRCRRFVVRGVIGLTIYLLFLLSDWQVTPDVFAIALGVRVGVVTPLAAIALLVLWFEPPPWLREGLSSIATILAACTSLGLMLISHSPFREGQHHALILVILFAAVVQRVRFPYAVVTALVCLGLHALAMAMVPEYPSELWLSANMIFGGAAVLALVANYSLERDGRLAYLVGLRDSMLNSDLSDLSLHDPLTGQRNRRALDAIVAVMEADTGRTEHLGVLMIDVDNFKLYNDSIGHQAGDACLQRVAALIVSEMRGQSDLTFRYGGEEFLILLPGADLLASAAVAERLRRAVEILAIPHPGLRPDRVVTVSIGVASARLGQGVTAAEIITGADMALYAAKRNGRNQVWPPFLGLRPAHPDQPDQRSAGAR